MPAQWTGKLIGDIHNAGETIKNVAARADLNDKYVSKVLNGDKDMPKTEAKLRAALEEMTREREADGAENLDT